MERNFPELVSIGYEGRDVDDLIRQLKTSKVRVLVDVRMTPISRKPGLSKGALSRALEAAGIKYVHHRELGNPKDNREGYRRGHQDAFDRFETILEEPSADKALKHVTELLDDGRVALLCYEHDANHCHRGLVTKALREREPDLFVHEL